MNNFFLLNEAINVDDYEIFIHGMSEINNIVVSKSSDHDRFEKHDSVWSLAIIANNLFTVNGLREKVIIELLAKLKTTSDYSSSVAELDLIYPNSCNAFLGIDFVRTLIGNDFQIKNLNNYNSFLQGCKKGLVFNSIEEFWAQKNDHFANLEFCENVFDQIIHLSINDDRFKLIHEKLKVLNKFTGRWKSGKFEYHRLGLDNSPDTPSRVRNTLKYRTFKCPDIGNTVFVLHIKWYFGKEPFRLYYYPASNNYKVYVGYIGPKDDIGF